MCQGVPMGYQEHHRSRALSANPIFLSVTGDQLEAVILFIDTADESTSRLIMFQDTGITGMPRTPDGNNVQIVVTAAGWFTL
jgi:hypothetical protein